MLRCRYLFGFFAGVWGCAWALLVVGFVLAIAGTRMGHVLLIAGGCLSVCLAIALLLRREVSARLDDELKRRGYALTSLGMPGLSLGLLAIGSAAVAGGVIGLA